MEVNHERAVNLITGSAEQGYIPAIEKLVSMYNSGEGVSRDYHKAVEWQKSLVEERKKKYESNPGETTALILLSDLWDLGDAYQALGQLSSAQNTYEEMRCFSEQFSQKYTDKRFTRYQSVSYNKLGDIAKAQGKLSDAEEWYRKSLAIDEALAEETGTVEARRGLSVSYEKLGHIAEAQGRLSEAEEWYRKSLAIDEALAEETGTVQARRNLSVSYSSLSDVAEAQGRLSDAEGWLRKALALRKKLSDETHSILCTDDLAACCSNLGYLTKDKAMLEQALGIWEHLAELYPENPRYRECAEIVKKAIQVLFPHSD